MRSLILLLTSALAACATTGAGDAGVAIETASRGQPLPGANCVVKTHSGSWNVVTPSTVAVGPTNGDLHVVCDKPGYRTSEFVFTPSGRYGSGSSIGIGLGGGGSRVGVGIGLSVPLSLGSHGYPTKVTIDMNPQ
ncbi:MAG TPA: hypothetical protein VEC06_16925 [Paucimonas sp.]|nr:hypothetical protein [Paucimonas sp.]